MHKNSLWKHRKSKHPDASAQSANIKCDVCDFACHQLGIFRQHLLDAHDVPLEFQSINFKDMVEFEAWRLDFESKNPIKFRMVSSGANSSKGKGVRRYVCNRSGHYKSQGSGKREGHSWKMNGSCTAGLDVKCDSSGSVTVSMCSSHYGHDVEVGALPLNKCDRDNIAGRILQGVKHDKIIDDARSDFDGEHLRPVHLIGKQSIRNTVRDYGLNTDQRHKNDAQSVFYLVEEAKGKADNPFLLYKPQGVLDMGLKESDFVLVIQDPMQAELMKTLGNNGKICIDSTHGTNAYNFYLTTIMTVDELGEGVPVAFIIANREDGTMLTKAFTAIKDNVGEVINATIMTDDAEQFYTAWSAVFGAAKKLLCSWHIDRSWKNSLKRHVKNKAVEEKVYQSLYALIII